MADNFTATAKLSAQKEGTSTVTSLNDNSDKLFNDPSVESTQAVDDLEMTTNPNETSRVTILSMGIRIKQLEDNLHEQNSLLASLRTHWESTKPEVTHPEGQVPVGALEKPVQKASDTESPAKSISLHEHNEKLERLKKKMTTAAVMIMKEELAKCRRRLEAAHKAEMDRKSEEWLKEKNDLEAQLATGSRLIASLPRLSRTTGINRPANGSSLITDHFKADGTAKKEGSATESGSLPLLQGIKRLCLNDLRKVKVENVE